MSGRALKVPVIMQMENLECGAACLAMVTAYYGKWLTLEQVRRDCGVSRDGSKAKNMLVAARSYGLKAKGYRYDLDHLQTEASLPCILHWGFDHFVVLCGWDRNGAVLNDPAKGRRTVSIDELDKQFTGICLQFKPTETFEKEGGPTSIWRFAKRRMAGTSDIVVFLMLIGIMLTFIGIVNPVFSQVFLDQILSGNNPDWLMPLLLVMTLVVVIQIGVNGINAIVGCRIQGKLAISANIGFINHLLHLPVTFYDQRQAGDLAARQQSNEGLAATLIGVFAPLAINIVMLLFYALIMSRYSLWLTLIGVGTVIINLGVTTVVSKKQVNIARVLSRDQGKLSSSTVGALKIIETIKASGSEDAYFSEWAGIQAQVNAGNVRSTSLTAWMGALPNLLFQVANVSVLLLGVLLILRGHFTVGMLTAFQSYMSAFISPAKQIMTGNQTYQQMRTAMERVEDVLHYPEDVTPQESVAKVLQIGGSLALNHLTFGYAPLGDPLLTDFNLSLKPGGQVALVGASGCGKSTISRLIGGLYKPWSGEVCVDGKNREDWPHDAVTGAISMVDQEIVLFEDTIKNNITLWDDTIEEEWVLAAAKDACIHDVILSRPLGYDDMVLDGGRNFSGGQRQCLEIARALARNPAILIMDEATSALDAATEDKVMKAIRRRHLTCVMIAHRLSTIRDCDEIIVMDHGQIRERGTHESLLAAGGIYAHLIAEE
ncbi:MAG: NHLP family bacteriocin export ABC transporter peptidase/permease/ATPase subunit [Eubacteriaceae bacterium]|nr:NHLP family bacteriocin export ABC transporter peptidase/permease/ATPase subunit [Eubacteriaceae bacterium]